jgi:hypothetical protein
MFKIIEESLTPPYQPLPESLDMLIQDCLNRKARLRPAFNEIVIRLKRLTALNVEI